MSHRECAPLSFEDFLTAFVDNEVGVSRFLSDRWSALAVPLERTQGWPNYELYCTLKGSFRMGGRGKVFTLYTCITQSCALNRRCARAPRFGNGFRNELVLFGYFFFWLK